MRAVVRKTRQIKNRGHNATFRVRGRLVDYNDVVRYWERKGVSIDDVVAQRSGSKTPEAVNCFTSPSSPLMMPESMAIPERILITIRDYFIGSFENGRWFTEDPMYHCESKKVQGDTFFFLNNLHGQCKTACRLFARNRFQEAGQILISATSQIKPILLAERPETLSSLFEIVADIFRRKRDEVAIAILRQFSALAGIVLGEKHPLCSICGWLTSIHASDFKYVMVKCWASSGDHFERLLGPMHMSTLVFRASLTVEDDLSHKRILLEELLGKCEASLGSLDARTLLVSSLLADHYYTQDDFKAIELGWDIVTKAQLLDKARSSQDSMNRAYFYTEGLYVVARSQYALGEVNQAEIHLREAIDSKTSLWGPRDAEVIKWLTVLEYWLFEQGQLEAAAEVQQRWKEALPESYD